MVESGDQSSLFDTDKEIQKTIKDEYEEIYNSTVKINKTELINLLKCSICKGIFRTPTTINECMHTFCRSCIYKHFYPVGAGTKDYCPACGVKLGGRPIDTLIFDNSLALLVDIVFPEFERMDKENEKKMYDAFRSNKEKLPGDDEEVKNNRPTTLIYLHPLETGDERTTLPRTDPPSIFVARNMNIESMKKYLEQKIDVSEKKIIIIYKDQNMPPEWTINDVDTVYQLDPEETIFYYARADNKEGEEEQEEEEK